MTQRDGTRHSGGITAGDGERERTFAALPPSRGRAFARTWWGTRWLKALEDTALDGEQLRRGRGFARQGAVGAVTVRPGRVTAVVRDRDGTAHRADVLLQELTETDWRRLLEVTARESGHLAALLDGEMPPRLVEDAQSVGVELLPGIGDLDPECGCEAWDHCPHTAALSYQLARLLDEDPFVLLLLRGRTQRELLDELGARSTAGAASAAGTASAHDPAGSRGGSMTGGKPQGVPAEEAFALGAILPPLPAPPPPVETPGGAPSLEGVGTPPATGVDAGALEFLVSDTASRAQQLLRDALSPSHAYSAPPVPLTQFQDAVRLAAAGPDQRIVERLSANCGIPPVSFRAAVRAWELGGLVGLTVWEESWTPEAEAMARARDQLATAWAEEDAPPPQLHVNRARWNTPDGCAQLRYGPDGRWWPYAMEHGTWWPAGGAEADPAAALAVALRQNEPGRGERS
ncbi:SWF or SNF family helicase [Streptomyces ovatisporus]|uniref:SWF or SNF family helicase n=1 Tax=Streptomyces ovatisporus TaxID=1128682 RepID=A0ABV9A811_9ACTN